MNITEISKDGAVPEQRILTIIDTHTHNEKLEKDCETFNGHAYSLRHRLLYLLMY